MIMIDSGAYSARLKTSRSTSAHTLHFSSAMPRTSAATLNRALFPIVTGRRK
jgi:hypothetical protein